MSSISEFFRMLKWAELVVKNFRNAENFLPKFVDVLSDFRNIVLCDRELFRLLLLSCNIPPDDTFHYIAIPLFRHFPLFILFRFRFFRTAHQLHQSFGRRDDVEGRRNCRPRFKIGNPKLGSGKLPFGIGPFGNSLQEIVTYSRAYLSEGPAVLLNICLGLKKKNPDLVWVWYYPLWEAQRWKIFWLWVNPWAWGAILNFFVQKQLFSGYAKNGSKIVIFEPN